MLQKTMVVVEGVARTLDPKLDMWATSEPVVRDWIERNLGPVGRIEEAGRGALDPRSASSATCPTWRCAPSACSASSSARPTAASRSTPESLEGIGEAEARRARWSAAALWVIAAVFIVFLCDLDTPPGSVHVYTSEHC